MKTTRFREYTYWKWLHRYARKKDNVKYTGFNLIYYWFIMAKYWLRDLKRILRDESFKLEKIKS